MKRLLAAVALAAVAAMAVVPTADARDGHRRGSRTTTTIIQGGGQTAFGLNGLNGGLDLGTALLLGALTGGGSNGLTAFGAQSGVNPLLLLLGQSSLGTNLGTTTIIEERSGRRHHRRAGGGGTDPLPAFRAGRSRGRALD